MGGVPTEERFQNITTNQWAILYKYLNIKKEQERKDQLDILEYIALLVSFNPKGAQKVINMRRKEANMRDKSVKDDFSKIDSSGKNVYGDSYNTTFFDEIRKFGGEAALKALGDVPTQQKVEESDNEEDDFIKEAKRLMKEEAALKLQDEEYRKQHENDNSDEIIF